MAKSGWCSQLGRTNHAGCKVPMDCSCGCPEDAAKVAAIRAETLVSSGVSASDRTLVPVESGAQLKVPHRRGNDDGAARNSTTPRGA